MISHSQLVKNRFGELRVVSSLQWIRRLTDSSTVETATLFYTLTKMLEENSTLFIFGRYKQKNKYVFYILFIKVLIPFNLIIFHKYFKCHSGKTCDSRWDCGFRFPRCCSWRQVRWSPCASSRCHGKGTQALYGNVQGSNDHLRG